jgi:hypothetical protein
MLIIKDLHENFRKIKGLSAAYQDATSLRDGNLCTRPVSNVGRTRATSHPCERGAGFLEN